MLLPLTELERVLDNQTAAFPAALHERRERVTEVRVRAEDIPEYDRVLDRNPGAHRQLRRGRVHGVADEQHALAIPWTGHEYGMQGPPIDARWFGRLNTPEITRPPQEEWPGPAQAIPPAADA